jgi:hypothetical protein
MCNSNDEDHNMNLLYQQLEAASVEPGETFNIVVSHADIFHIMQCLDITMGKCYDDLMLAQESDEVDDEAIEEGGIFLERTAHVYHRLLDILRKKISDALVKNLK